MYIVHTAQFGVTKDKPIDTAATAAATANQEQSNENLTTLTEQDANDIAALIEAAGEDPQTIQMIAKLKDDNGHLLHELKQLPDGEILNGMKHTLDDLKGLEYLFQDRDFALREMEKEGLIPEQHLKKYKKDPALLEQDTRQGLYFQFVSLAVVGGYL